MFHPFFFHHVTYFSTFLPTLIAIGRMEKNPPDSVLRHAIHLRHMPIHLQGAQPAMDESFLQQMFEASWGKKNTAKSDSITDPVFFFWVGGRGKGQVSGWHFQKVLWLKYPNDLETSSKGNGWYWKREHKISFFFLNQQFLPNNLPRISTLFIQLLWGEI